MATKKVFQNNLFRILSASDLVADTADSLYQIAALAQFLAQGADMDIHGAVFTVEGISPDRTEKLISCQYQLAVFQQHT